MTEGMIYDLDTARMESGFECLFYRSSCSISLHSVLLF